MDQDNTPGEGTDATAATTPVAPTPRRAARRRAAEATGDQTAVRGDEAAVRGDEDAPVPPATSPTVTTTPPTATVPTVAQASAPDPEPALYLEPHRSEFRVGEPRPGNERPAGERSAGEARPTAELPRTGRGDPRRMPEPAAPTNIYRARRPAVAAGLIIPAVLIGLLLLRALAISAFGTPFLINGVIASCLSLTSLPLLVTGLYGLLTGAAYGAEHVGFKVWARPPLAYLVVGLVFVVGAGLAIG